MKRNILPRVALGIFRSCTDRIIKRPVRAEAAFKLFGAEDKQESSTLLFPAWSNDIALTAVKKNHLFWRNYLR